MINLKLKSRNYLPIGLDIGHSSIKMVQLAKNGGQIRVLDAQKVLIEPVAKQDEQKRKNFIVSSIKNILSDRNFYGRNVVSTLPNENIKITSLRVDQNDSEQISKNVLKEASQRFGLEPEKDAIKYMKAGDVCQGDETRNELILFVADNQSVTGHIELLQEIGLRPVGLDALPCALFRSFERSLQRQEDKEKTSVFIDIGSRFTTVVFGRGQNISFIKQISMGMENFDREIEDKLGVNETEAELLRNKAAHDTEKNQTPQTNKENKNEQNTDNPASEDKQKRPPENELDPSTRQLVVDAVTSVSEKLVSEISMCFRYYTVTFRGRRVERAVFSGGGIYEKILIKVLKRQLAVNIETAQPLRGFDMADVDFNSDKRSTLSEWSVVVGLSLKGFRGLLNSEN